MLNFCVVWFLLKKFLSRRQFKGVSGFEVPCARSKKLVLVLAYVHAAGASCSYCVIVSKTQSTEVNGGS
jgi:hypothetical protein